MTAALDTESEQLVQQSLETVRHGKTAIVVAHRLATVMNADRILVFKYGKIHESGTHLELLEKDCLYANRVKHQPESIILINTLTMFHRFVIFSFFYF